MEPKAQQQAKDQPGKEDETRNLDGMFDVCALALEQQEWSRKWIGKS